MAPHSASDSFSTMALYKSIYLLTYCEKLTSEALRYGSHSFYTTNLPYPPLPRSPDGATSVVRATIWFHNRLLLIYWPQEDERLSWPS